MFLELRITKELASWRAKQSEQVKVKNPTRKIDVWGTPASSEARSKNSR